MGTIRAQRASTFVLGFLALCISTPTIACVTADDLTVDVADTNSDGVLDLPEVVNILIDRISCPESPVLIMATELLGQMDENNDGAISIDEFEARGPFDNGIPNPEAILFENADTDRNEIVTSNELIQSLIYSTLPVLTSRASAFIEGRDTDGSGTLNDVELNAAKRTGPNGPRN